MKNIKKIVGITSLVYLMSNIILLNYKDISVKSTEIDEVKDTIIMNDDEYGKECNMTVYENHNAEIKLFFTSYNNNNVKKLNIECSKNYKLEYYTLVRNEENSGYNPSIIITETKDSIIYDIISFNCAESYIYCFNLIAESQSNNDFINFKCYNLSTTTPIAYHCEYNFYEPTIYSKNKNIDETYDLNNDGILNAEDAAVVLQIAAMRGAGYTIDTLYDYDAALMDKLN